MIILWFWLIFVDIFHDFGWFFATWIRIMREKIRINKNTPSNSTKKSIQKNKTILHRFGHYLIAKFRKKKFILLYIFTNILSWRQKKHNQKIKTSLWTAVKTIFFDLLLSRWYGPSMYTLSFTYIILEVSFRNEHWTFMTAKLANLDMLF